MSENPYAPPSVTVLPPEKQTIWTKEIKSARTILIVVGIIQLLFGGFYITRAREEFDKGVAQSVKEMGPGYVVDQKAADAAFEENKVLVYGLASVPLVLGVFFLIMACLVYKHPAGVTLTSLIVFIIAHVATAIVEPSSIIKGVILKVIFVVILVKAYKSARSARALQYS